MKQVVELFITTVAMAIMASVNVAKNMANDKSCGTVSIALNILSSSEVHFMISNPALEIEYVGLSERALLVVVLLLLILVLELLLGIPHVISSVRG